MAQPVAQPARAIGDVSAFHGSPQTLIRIINDVEQTNPGRVIEIRFDDSSGTPGFDVAIVHEGQVTFMRLEREGGELTPVAEQSQAVWMMNMRKMDNTRLAAKAPVSLADAIRTAEGNMNGEPAVAAGIATGASDPTTDVHAYNILILQNDGSTHRIAVDSETGAVIANPSALTGWPN
jgi:uncharacterized membrane protein YkoI